jgi:hypothetical protein
MSKIIHTTISLFLIFALSFPLFAQKEGNVWIFGDWFENADTNYFGITTLHFEDDTFSLLPIKHVDKLHFDFTNTSLADFLYFIRYNLCWRYVIIELIT